MRVSENFPKPVHITEALLQKSCHRKVPLESVLLPDELRLIAVTAGWNSQAVDPTDAHVGAGQVISVLKFPNPTDKARISLGNKNWLKRIIQVGNDL